MKVRIEKYIKQLALMLIDIAIIYLAVFIGLLFRLEGNIPVFYKEIFILHSSFYAVIFIILFHIFGLYRSLWEYAGTKELLKISSACIIGTIAITFIEYILPERLPLSVPAISCLALILLIGGVRMSYRVLKRISKRRGGILKSNSRSAKRTMIIGAGDAGSIMIKEMLFNPSTESRPVIVIDDDRKKHGKNIYGIKIEGGCRRIPDLVKKYNVGEIIFAIPSAKIEEKKTILNICSQTSCNLRMMPSISQLDDFKNFRESLRPVRIEDLLGRDEVDLYNLLIAEYLYNKTVLITGGGGSIGSEIARQVIKFKPKKIVVMDIYENSVYRLLNELNINGCEIDIDIEIGSIRDEERLEDVFIRNMPEVVFHAAAHKHVPFMEACPSEAVKNNIIGTLNTAKMADKYRTLKFVLISTDKAVNPTSVMGATKRVTEMITQYLDKQSKTIYTAVRFGNVLGSNGSVIPLFKSQIEAGGPVTITHTEIKRYFMTVQEAAKLVIQSGAIAGGGEVFVLDMGEPIKIIDLAKNLIRLSGLIPGEDIKIEIIGLRPGEKMFEEILMDEEGVSKTQHDKIFVGKSTNTDFNNLMEDIDLLIKNVADPLELKRILAKMVPTYRCKENISTVKI